MSLFFTIWINSTLVIVMLGAARFPTSLFADRRVQCVALASIALTAAIFYIILEGGRDGTPLEWIAKVTLHALTPALALATFLAARHIRLPWRAALWGLIPPAIYGPTLLIRGLITDEWPYFFLDYPDIGLTAFTLWSIGIFAAFLAFTGVFVALERALSA